MNDDYTEFETRLTVIEDYCRSQCLPEFQSNSEALLAIATSILADDAVWRATRDYIKRTSTIETEN